LDNYIISYDLNKQGKNYDGLISAIKQLSYWAKIQKSVWYVKSKLTTDQIYEFLRKQMDGNDSLIVVNASSNNAVWYGVGKSASDYMKENWPK